MNVRAFPFDETKRERLLLRLDVELLESVARMIAIIDRSVSTEAKAALALSFETLVDLLRELPHLPAQTPQGERVRNAIYLHCVEIFETVQAHRNGRPENLGQSA